MKASYEGKFVLEIGKLAVVACKGEGYSYTISGDKPITVLPELGVILQDRKLSFEKSTAVCIEERETYVLVGPYAQSIPLVKAAVMFDPLMTELSKEIADFLDDLPEDGDIVEFISKLSYAATKLPDWETSLGALVEFWNIIKIKYPEKAEKYLASFSETDKKQLDDLITKIKSLKSI